MLTSLYFTESVYSKYWLGFSSPTSRGPSYLGEILHWLGLQKPKEDTWLLPGSPEVGKQ